MPTDLASQSSKETPSDDTHLLTVGQAAAALGVTARTLKYYEELNLVVPARSGGRYRMYTQADLATFGRILRMRSLGFSIAAITEMLKRPMRLVESGKSRMNEEDLQVVRDALHSQLGTLRERTAQVRRELREAEKLEAQIAHDLQYIEQRLSGVSADELLAERAARIRKHSSA
ncbi:MerR family transcriptional regulator [Pandoraea communis]|uniref:MerR family DNA-binding transcriptional regulator n=1 Tax=Pandoraea communis TaxID=2508297 RepID=A0A5E4STC4_9BURK|nr:MerR family transcriptional regulator [Pandoraea communis]MDM8356979.1 MerR family transcriptional regulator [Pandoraea communis]VVD77484.1 MerR family DNA-binding transcriptional regulator [Pandoraea communis]